MQLSNAVNVKNTVNIIKDILNQVVTMMKQWYEDEKKVIELAEFLVQSVEIVNVDELLEYFKRPERYTEVWNIYEKEMLGTLPSTISLSKKGHLYQQDQHGTKTMSVCGCGIS